MDVRRVDHVQLAMPAGGETHAKWFYGYLLGIAEVPKPSHLAARGGCWFECGDLKIHLGVDTEFRPARKAHPGLIVDDLATLTIRLLDAGIVVAEDEPLAGFRRVYVDDPFGNRIELLEPVQSRLTGTRADDPATVDAGETTLTTPTWLAAFIDAFNTHDAPAIGELLTVDIDYSYWQDRGWVTVEGRARVVELLSGLMAHWSSDVTITPTSVVADAQAFAVEYHENGTHDRGPNPTGRNFSLRNVMVGQLRHGRICRITDYSDVTAYRQQTRDNEPQPDHSPR